MDVLKQELSLLPLCGVYMCTDLAVLDLYLLLLNLTSHPIESKDLI